MVSHVLKINPTYPKQVREEEEELGTRVDTNFVFVSVHSVQYSDFVHFVAYSDSEHSVHSENMAQPPTPPGPRERTLRDDHPRLMLQISTTIDLSINNKSMIHLKQDTNLLGEIIQILSGMITHNNNLLMHHFRTILLDIIDHIPVQQKRQQQVTNDPPPAPSEPSLEELSLTAQMGKMDTSLYTLQSQNSVKLPSQTMINSNVSVITLRLMTLVDTFMHLQIPQVLHNNHLPSFFHFPKHHSKQENGRGRQGDRGQENGRGRQENEKFLKELWTYKRKLE
ncbi:hypothetical protein Lal_00015305, partial [Lupinus albus]